MNTRILKKAVGIGVAAALAAGVSTAALAAPVGSGSAAIKNAAPSNVVDVRHWRRGAPWVAGAVGLGLGLALASPYYYQPYYYDEPVVYRRRARPNCWVPATPWQPGYWTYC
jgi:hypothetical protein